jgi:DNA-binding SARP family transcriptional activator
VVHLCGGQFVTVGERRLEVPEGCKRLLAFAALRRGHVERREAAGALWPVGDDNRAAGNLRSALWRLRGVGIDVLEADKWSISLSRGVQVDTTLIGEWATRLINAAPAESDLDSWRSSMDALDLLPGWYDDWVIMERERLRQRLLHALEALTRLLVQRHRYADAVDVAMLAVHAEPLRESAQRALIEAHLAEENIFEARRAYVAYRELVRRELRVEPSDDLTRLVRMAGRKAASARDDDPPIAWATSF